MPRKISRYEIVPGAGFVSLSMPKDAKVVEVGYGRDGIYKIHLWTEVHTNTEFELEERTFQVFQTGSLIPDKVHGGWLHFLGTAQDPSMRVAQHVYEVRDYRPERF